jgi:3-hydroxyisobutyrate dehydrogenase-like beta-hydroxyacid dehydrogenase
MTASNPLTSVALIGFGEAGGIIGQDLAAQGIHVRVYDRLLDEPARRDAILIKATATQVEVCDSAAAAALGVQLVISAVTAGSALSVATELAVRLQPGQVFMDINSVAPTTKQAAGSALQASGVHYVDAAVMAPVPPQRLKTPILLGGDHAAALARWLEPLGFNVNVVADRIGVASAIKMCRSIMIKGLEALTTECLSTARQYGAEDLVLASLHKSFPQMGWNAQQPHYLISRVAEHGRRRAEEMEEVARTAADVGVEPNMSRAIVATQRGLVDAMARQGLVYAEPFEWQRLIDVLHRPDLRIEQPDK